MADAMIYLSPRTAASSADRPSPAGGSGSRGTFHPTTLPGPAHDDAHDRHLLDGDALERRFQEFAEHGGAVALLELDGLDSIAEAYGRSAADALVTAAGRRLLAAVRPDDYCAGMGVAEFCVLLGGVRSARDPLAVAGRIQLALQGITILGSPAPILRASTGIALWQPGDPATEAMRRARGALARARMVGGGRTELDEAVWAARVMAAAPEARGANDPSIAPRLHPAPSDGRAPGPLSRLLGWLRRR